MLLSHQKQQEFYGSLPQHGNEKIKASERSDIFGSKIKYWIALSLCAAVLAAVLSLFLVSTPSWMPRRLLLAAGWTATIIVAMIGPAAFWMIITSLINGGAEGPKGMAGWVPLLLYSSWFLFAIAIGAATRSYQLRTAISPREPDDKAASDVSN